MLRRSVAAALLMLGCGTQVASQPINHKAIDMVICLEIPLEQRAEAQKAVEAWDKSLANWRRVKLGKAGCTVTVVEADHQLESDAWAIAWTSADRRTIVMRRGAYEQDTSGILMHELGHTLGAQHIRATLMAPLWNAEYYRCPDVATVAQVAAWWHIDIGLLRWCENDGTER